MTTLIELNGHKVNPANDKLRIFVLDEKGSGGAYHVYAILTPIKDKIKEETCSSSQEADLEGGFKMKLWPFQGFAKIYKNEETAYYTINLVSFQNGPINEVGVNGQTHEAYLAILIHRLECFQAGPFKGEFNENALRHLKEARMWLLERTRERMTRGVEGTHNK
ncbi:conserved hypothetical protein [Azospirillaceae bacterium]